MKAIAIIAVMIVLMMPAVLTATILNVPSPAYPTIQAGIDSSINGDTVLVQPGTYVENINFNGHNIVLGSLFLTTSDTSYISSTIIDGNSAGSVVTFESGEDSTAIITGFTIQNGYNINGGGIYCFHSIPVICANVINNNYSYGSGGGILSDALGTKICNNEIAHNHAGFYGGGIMAWGYALITGNIVRYNTSMLFAAGIFIADHNLMILKYNIICHNSTFGTGGGIVTVGVSPIINNTFYFNFAQQDGGGVFSYLATSPAILINNIFWLNDSNGESKEIYATGFLPSVTYCNIQGGYPGEGNIDCNPMFCNPEAGNFYLADNSCCLGAGEGGADIGALGVGCASFGYLLGDINMYNGVWQPAVLGSDATYLINFLRSSPTSLPCLISGFWVSADVNGDCQVIGSDVTKIVNYLKGMAGLNWCPDYPPRWLMQADLPVEMPPSWPGCE